MRRVVRHRAPTGPPRKRDCRKTEFLSALGVSCNYREHSEHLKMGCLGNRHTNPMELVGAVSPVEPRSWRVRSALPER
jgi:hypothetical protein